MVEPLDPKPSGDAGRRRSSSRSSEDFLYHLYRGSNMLLQDQVHEAKAELEQALKLQPQDAKSQDLLAGVYFRLGVYPQAIEIWKGLTEVYGEDATLRVNLGLALFKTGQADEALEQIHEALKIQPDHGRAWGYLGLIRWRLGQLEAARDAFLRGGQAAMAKRMEEALGNDASAGPTPSMAAEALEAEDRRAMRDAAEEAIARFESAKPDIAVAEQGRERRKTGRWESVEPGSEPVPKRGAPAGTRIEGVALLQQQLEEWTVDLPESLAFAVGPDGRLHCHSQHDLFVRLATLQAVHGNLDSKMVQRRARGKDLDEYLGADDPIFQVKGPSRMTLEVAKEETIVVVALQEDILYVRESRVLAFDDRSSFESARLPFGKEPVPMLQLHGSGFVALRFHAHPTALPVRDGQELRVNPERVLGWTGRLFPNMQKGTAPYSLTAPRLVFRGEGAVLLG
ncbi:MAG: tetratricopeptide repeat protein [Deltaproteobacteria bacterium]|nr:tetratricopeptide repeat protein [Deltaproteobacteria bacterium]